MKKNIAIALFLGGCMIFTGCEQQEVLTNKSQQETEKAKGYIDTIASVNKTSRENIAKATEEQNKKIEEAMNVLEEEPTQTTINEKQIMENIPSQINMSLAQTCKSATITTSKGDVTISFYNDDAPITVANFCTLAQNGFYDGVIFHRVIKDFMIQGGDPTGTGTGGPDYKFDDEIHANNKNNTGTIAMANSGPGTNGSQFFINVNDNNYLDTKHTVFGKVTAGMDVVTEIENAETGAMDKPVEEIKILSVKITQ